MESLGKAGRDWMADLMRDRRYVAYFMPLLFNDLPGSTASVLRRMRAALEHVHATLLDHVAEEDEAAAERKGKAPLRLFAAPARFVPVRARKGPDDAGKNGGLHLRAVLLVPRRYWMARRLERHIEQNQAIYCDLRGRLRRVEAERVERGAEWKAAELLFQGIERDAVLREETLIAL